ncbi:MAG TPA: hypothetical protein VL947_08085 [Cytophagales bacterium]|nr:hypothetical protein [Cytophagales bacterium]
MICIGAGLALASCTREYNAKHITKVPQKVEKSDDYLARQAVDITDDNIDRKDLKAKKRDKRTQKEQDRLNELNKSPYKVKTKKVNDRKYTIYE